MPSITHDVPESSRGTSNRQHQYNQNGYSAQAYGRIEPWQRYKRRNPCPICNGGDDDKRGRSERCSGYISGDETHAYCTREEYGGDLRANTKTAVPTYAHRLNGECGCGLTHGQPVYVSRKDASPKVKQQTRSHLVTPPSQVYTYRNADGTPHMRVLRIERDGEKTFRQQRPDGVGDWLDGLEDVTPVLYRLDDLATADPWEPVFIVEGEKCVEALVDRGQVATCNPGGALKWHKVGDSQDALRGRHVVILPDNDPENLEKPAESRKGQRHAQEVAQALMPIAASVRVLELPGLPEKGDVYDWLADGHTVGELRALAAETKSITALLMPAQDSSGTRQVDMGGTTCLNCARERERCRVAETSLDNLRRAHQFEKRVMAQAPTKLKPTVKLAYLALRHELQESSHVAFDDQGRARVYRSDLAKRLGVTPQTVSGYFGDMKAKGLISHDVDKSDPTDYKMFVGAGPLWDTPWDVDESESAWGGTHAVKACPTCYKHGVVNTEIEYTAKCSAGHVHTLNELKTVHLLEDGTVDPRDLPDDGLTTDDMPDAPSDTPNTSLPEDMKTCQVGATAKNPGQNDRATVLALAEALGWPRVQIAPGTHVGPSRDVWERFTTHNTGETIEQALAALGRFPVALDYGKEASA